MYISETHTDAANRTTRPARSATGPLWSVVASIRRQSSAGSTFLMRRHPVNATSSRRGRDLARCILAELSSSRSRSCVINLRGQATAGVEAALWRRRFCGNAPIEVDRVLVVLRPHGLRGLAQLHGLLPHGLHRALEHGLQIELAVAVVIRLDHQRLRLSSGVASGGHLRAW